MDVNTKIRQHSYNHALDFLKGWPSPHAVDIVAPGDQPMRNRYPALSADLASDDKQQVCVDFLRQLAAERGWRLPTTRYHGRFNLSGLWPLFYAENIAVYEADFVPGDGFADPRATLAARLEEYQTTLATLDDKRRQRVDALLADLEAATPEQRRRLAEVFWPLMAIQHTSIPSATDEDRESIRRAMAADTGPAVVLDPALVFSFAGNRVLESGGSVDGRVDAVLGGAPPGPRPSEAAAAMRKTWVETFGNPLDLAVQAAVAEMQASIDADTVLAGRLAPAPAEADDPAIVDALLALGRRWHEVFGRDLRIAWNQQLSYAEVLEQLRGLLYDKEHKGIDPPTCTCGCGVIIGCVNQGRSRGLSTS